MAQRMEWQDADLLAPVVRGHAERHALCDRLEACADRLPDLPGNADLLQLGSAISEVASLRFPEAEAAFACALPPATSHEALQTLAQMHSLDALHGEDLMHVLWTATRTPPEPDIDAIGYMLRCYFDGCRRAIAFEQLLIAMVRGG